MILTEEKKKVTPAEFMQLNEVNVELIDGEIVREPTPSYGHQHTSLQLVRKLLMALDTNGKGEILCAPMDVFLDEHVVQPDILFISKERAAELIIEDRIKGAPDVVFELVSPSNAFNDTKRKFDIYERYGVKEYFLVYPEDKTVVKYALQNNRYHEVYREKGLVTSEAMDCSFNF